MINRSTRLDPFSIVMTCVAINGRVPKTLAPFIGMPLSEYEKGMKIIYEGYNDVLCTYELDDTPPFHCNDEAREIALKIAALLNTNIIEEMHVCRKNYLDGSVPAGFQRTMILGTDGYITLENGKKIGINILSLEEDSARKSKTEDKTNFFRLDRLGIPLVGWLVDKIGSMGVDLLQSYIKSFWVIPVSIIIAIIMGFLIKETRCSVIYEEDSFLSK